MQLEQRHRAIEADLHTLTWSSLNIDAHIVKVHRALDLFETLISNITINSMHPVRLTRNNND
jgi:hypothetical protein